MKRNSILEQRRKSIPQDVRDAISLSFSIVDRIHEILERQGKTQKDLAKMLNKSEAEISKWMRGNHNFTTNTISKIQNVLGESIIEISSYNKDKITCHYNITMKTKINSKKIQFKSNSPSFSIKKNYNITES